MALETTKLMLSDMELNVRVSFRGSPSGVFVFFQGLDIAFWHIRTLCDFFKDLHFDV